jgi:hypothetical protein
MKEKILIAVILLVGSTEPVPQPAQYQWPERHLALERPVSDSKARYVGSRYWDIGRSKNYAQTLLKGRDWQGQWTCLEKLWHKESNWRPRAYNKTPVYLNGVRYNAGGIPQLLGLDPKLHARTQIQKGLKYIQARYPSGPCEALAFHLRKNWY